MIVTLGDLTLDILVKQRPGLPEGSPGSVTMNSGGSAAHFAVWVSRLGGEARFIGKVGSDPAANLLLYDLLKEGVLPDTVTGHGSTATVTHVQREHGGIHLIPDRGVAVKLRPDEVQPAWLADARWLHLPSPSLLALPIGTAAAKAVRLAREVKAKVSIDLSPAKGLREYGVGKLSVLLKSLRPDVVFVGEPEAALFAPGVLGELAQIAVLKLHEGGCGVSDGKGYKEYPPEKLRTVDRAGSSEAFDAAWCLTYATTGSVEEACRRGVKLLARVASRHGPRPEVDLKGLTVD